MEYLPERKATGLHRVEFELSRLQIKYRRAALAELHTTHRTVVPR